MSFYTKEPESQDSKILFSEFWTLLDAAFNKPTGQLLNLLATTIISKRNQV